MPSIGEQGWGNLVSNNFEILDTISNTFNTQIDTINKNLITLNLATASGTRILSILLPNTTTNTINSENFEEYASYDNNNVYIASFGSHTIFESISTLPHSCRLMIISVNGNATFNGNINTYPTTLQSELPPGTPETNIYNNNINFVQISYEITLEYTANQNNSILNMNQQDYLNFINKTLPPTTSQTNKSYQLSIPHAIAAGGYGNAHGTAGTAENTCNGGGGGYSYSGSSGNTFRGGTGCIFGQYASSGGWRNGYGYGSSASNKYRCGLVIIVNGNLTINESSTITQIGGDGSGNEGGGYGGGSRYAGGGGAPVFIYYTGTYTNNGTINTAGGNSNGSRNGGAGGIKTTKITL